MEVPTTALTPRDERSPAAQSSHLFQNAAGFDIVGGQFVLGDVHNHIPSREHTGVSVENIGNAYSESEIYCSQLLRQKRGFPLYVPGPQRNLPDEYQRSGVAIGDVGRVTPDGIFDFFFNIYLPADHPINANVPEDFCPMPHYASVDVLHLDFGPGNYVSTSTVQKLDLDAPLDEFPGGDFVFDCGGPQGAVLALPNGAHVAKLENLASVQKYAATHAESWYKYINGARGRGLANGSLYLITGCEKAQSWGIASFHSDYDDFQLAFKPTARTDGTSQYRWSGVHGRKNPAQRKSFNPPQMHGVPLNQTTFVHGLSISLATGIWGRLFGDVKISPIVDSHFGNINGGLVQHAQGSSLFSWSLSFLGGGATTGRKHHTGRDEDVVISEISPISKIFHPAEVINNYILYKAPQAAVIMSHDDDWCDILRDDDTGSEIQNPSELLQRISERFDVTEKDGTAFLVPKSALVTSAPQPDTESRASSPSYGQDPFMSTLAHQKQPRSELDSEPQKQTTLFVGSISDGITDATLNALLAACGPTAPFKRLMTPANKPQDFGFAEFEKPDGALRALALLNNVELPALEDGCANKRLLIKAEEKTRAFLDAYASTHPLEPSSVQASKAVIDTVVADVTRITAAFTSEKEKYVVPPHLQEEDLPEIQRGLVISEIAQSHVTDPLAPTETETASISPPPLSSAHTKISTSHSLYSDPIASLAAKTWYPAITFAAMRSDIPYDIWRHVASFLPVAVLLTTLYSVNRAFLDLALEIRYQAITFAAYETAKPLIKHVKDSNLVHSVRVQPWIVRAKDPKPRSSWSSLTRKVLNALPTHKFDEDVEARVLRRLRKQIQRVTTTINGLPNLNKYQIDWDEGPVQKEFFSALLHSAIPVVGRGLCSLSLKVPLPYMHTLPSLAQHLPNLEHLAIALHTGPCTALDISRSLEGLVVFINALLHKLHSFSLHTTSTSTYLDLGPLFDHLGHGKRLSSFTLCIPFDGRHLTDPEPLWRFLFKHRSTLESLALRTMRAAYTTPGASQAKFWIRETLKDHPLPALSRLSLGLRPLRTELGPLLRYLAQMTSQLSVLRLLERPLEYTELAQILDVLDEARLLRVLALRIRWLSPEVIDLLAARLPALSTLELIFTEVVHQEPTSDASTHSAESYDISRESELTLFCQALEKKKYSDWNLTRLAVPESPRGRTKWLDAMERAFVSCIPGLTSFEELVSSA